MSVPSADLSADLGTDEPVWYVAYASNLSRERFLAYLRGGQPVGSRRHYSGGRDPSQPRGHQAIRLAGRLGFAGTSTVWGGGLAFLDPEGEGEVVARAYLVTFGQFSDVVAQEARRDPGRDLVRGVDGRLGAMSRIYDTILELEPHEGVPVMTMTASGSSGEPPVAPSAPYLSTILAGLADGCGLDAAARVDYLLQARGVAPTWDRAALLALDDARA
jgi:hypothetical protein